MIKMLERSLKQDIPYYRKKHSSYLALGENGKNILACFRDHPETRLRSGQVATLTGMPRRTVTRLLEELVRSEFLQQMGKGAAVRYQLIF